MKTIYSILITISAFVMFSAAALADPGTRWHRQINDPTRFVVLADFDDGVVLDRETGRVWQRNPHGRLRVGEVPREFSWFGALQRCYRLEVGGRKGWRLPTIEELASLVDTSQANPALPAGHPSTNVQSSFYWSATSFAGDASLAWAVHFSDGNVGSFGKSLNFFVWCVRGGQGIDGVQ